jgi:hypothetical protein
MSDSFLDKLDEEGSYTIIVQGEIVKQGSHFDFSEVTNFAPQDYKHHPWDHMIHSPSTGRLSSLELSTPPSQSTPSPLQPPSNFRYQRPTCS